MQRRAQLPTCLPGLYAERARDLRWDWQSGSLRAVYRYLFQQSATSASIHARSMFRHLVLDILARPSLLVWVVSARR